MDLLHDALLFMLVYVLIFKIR